MMTALAATMEKTLNYCFNANRMNWNPILLDCIPVVIEHCTNGLFDKYNGVKPLQDARNGKDAYDGTDKIQEQEQERVA